MSPVIRGCENDQHGPRSNAVRHGKLLAYKTSTMDFENAMLWSETAIPLVSLSDDNKEGFRSFREKRDPSFRGY